MAWPPFRQLYAPVHELKAPSGSTILPRTEIDDGLEQLCKPPFPPERIQRIADLLEHLDSHLNHNKQQAWKDRPRAYTVFHMINALEFMKVFADEGLTDFDLPFEYKTWPACLRGREIQSAFFKAQKHVLTIAKEMEKEEGIHQNLDESADVHFHSIRVLGQGGFGRVDLVWSKLSLKKYARKRVLRCKSPKKKHERLVTEVQILKKLTHRHLIKYVGSYTDREYTAYLMEPIADIDLQSYLNSRDATYHTNRTRIQHFYGCLAGAVHYLHTQKIRHCDITSSNVFIKDDCAYLGDFGTAKDFSSTERSTTHDRVPINYPYIAPEVARSQPRNTSSDMWSLGVVFLEITTVLLGHKLKSFWSHMERSSFDDDDVPSVQANLPAASSWLNDIKSEDVDEANEPIAWIKSLLEIEPRHRLSSKQLMIQIKSTPSFHQFCCFDCWNDYGGDFEYDNDCERVGVSSRRLDKDEIQAGVAELLGQNATVSKAAQPACTDSVAKWLTHTIEGKASRMSDAADDARPISPAKGPAGVHSAERSQSPASSWRSAETSRSRFTNDSDHDDTSYNSEDDASDNDGEGVLNLGRGYLLEQDQDTSEDGDSIEDHVTSSRGYVFVPDDSDTDADLTDTSEDSMAIDAIARMATDDASPTPDEEWHPTPTPTASQDAIEKAFVIVGSGVISISPGDVQRALRANEELSQKDQHQALEGSLLATSRPQDLLLQRMEEMGKLHKGRPSSVGLRNSKQDSESQRQLDGSTAVCIQEKTYNSHSGASSVGHDSPSSTKHIGGLQQDNLSDETEQKSLAEEPNSGTHHGSHLNLPPQPLPSERVEAAPSQQSLASASTPRLEPGTERPQSKAAYEESPKATKRVKFDKDIPATTSNEGGSPSTGSQSNDISSTSGKPSEEMPSGKPSPGVSAKRGVKATWIETRPPQRSTHVAKPGPGRSGPELKQDTASTPAHSESELPSTETRDLGLQDEQVQEPISSQSQNQPRDNSRDTSHNTPEPKAKASFVGWARRSKRKQQEKLFPQEYLEQIRRETQPHGSQASSKLSQGTLDRLRKLDWNPMLDRSYSLLEKYCKKGEWKSVRILLTSGVNPGTKKKKRPVPMLNAVLGASSKHTDCVRVLLEFGGDPHVRDRARYKKTTLQLAIENKYSCEDGYTRLISLLVFSNVDPNAKDSNGEYTIEKIFKGSDSTGLDQHRLRALGLLLQSERGTNVNIKSSGTQDTPLHLAVRRRSSMAVALLLHMGADANAVNSSGSTPLLSAALMWRGELKPEEEQILVMLTKCEGAHLDAANGSLKRTALHYAVVAGAPVAVEVLLEAGADVQKKDNSGHDVLKILEERRLRQTLPEDDDIQGMLQEALNGLSDGPIP